MTTPQPLDEAFFIWLYSQVADTRHTDPSLTYWNVLRLLYEKEFTGGVPNDDNRKQDGKNLRIEFVRDEGIEDADPEWMDFGCSMLELMVGLSRRLSHNDLAGGQPHYWFWRLMSNIGLQRYDDRTPIPKRRIDTEILDRVIERTYEPNGMGGFFPLQNPGRDQRTVELWNQLSAYIEEQSG